MNENKRDHYTAKQKRKRDQRENRLSKNKFKEVKGRQKVNYFYEKEQEYA